jgi:hypothetical protein
MDQRNFKSHKNKLSRKFWCRFPQRNLIQIYRAVSEKVPTSGHLEYTNGQMYTVRSLMPTVVRTDNV